MEGDYRQLREHLVLLAHALIPTVEGARQKTERELLSRVASLDWQFRGPREFFDRVASDVCKVLDARGCSVFVYEAEPEPQLRLIGSTGLFDPKTNEKLTRAQLDTLSYRAGEGLTGWILNTLRPVRLFDARDQNEYQEIDPSGGFEPFFKSAETPDATSDPRPFLGMPIFAGEEKNRANLVGVIRLHGKGTGDFFLPCEERHLEAVSGHLARSIQRWKAALDNVEALEQEKALVDIVKAIHVEHDVKSILETITQHAKQLFKAQAASALLKVPERDELAVEVDRADREQLPQQIRFGFDQGICGHAAKHREVVLVPDVSKDARFYNLNNLKPGLLAEVKSEAAAPIVHRDEVLGVLNVDSTRLGFFRPDDQRKAELLRMLADHAAIAISRERMQRRRASLQGNLMRSTEELTAIHKAKGLVHQFRNLMAPIIPELGAMIDQASAARDRSLHSLAKGIHEKTQAIYDFADKLIRLPTSDRPLLTHVHLNQLVAEAEELFEPFAAQKRICIELKLSPGLGRPDAGFGKTVELDELQMHLVLWNVVQNAIDASKEDSVIEIMTKDVPPGRVAIVVRDYGSGIKKSDVGKIFDEDFSTKTTGSGVGLPLSKKYVQGHGGEILVETKWKRGSTFTVVLPSVASKGEP